MKIDNAEIIINQSSLFELEAPDSVMRCLIRIKKSSPGVEHPIRIKSGVRFEYNAVQSEIPEPILLDRETGDDFLGVGDNCFHYK